MTNQFAGERRVDVGVTIDLQKMANDYRKIFAAANKWSEPSLQKALMFAQTELGESFEAYLRTLGDDNFVRNNEKVFNENEIAEELCDTILMCLVALDCLGQRADRILTAKLDSMAAKRGLVVEWRINGLDVEWKKNLEKR